MVSIAEGWTECAACGTAYPQDQQNCPKCNPPRLVIVKDTLSISDEFLDGALIFIKRKLKDSSYEDNWSRTYKDGIRIGTNGRGAMVFEVEDRENNIKFHSVWGKGPDGEWVPIHQHEGKLNDGRDYGEPVGKKKGKKE
jgi:hypothetical protein